MATKWRVVWRKGHRWAALLTALPFLLVIVSGLLLQVKKEWSWVQPPTAKGSAGGPRVSLDEILGAARSVPEAGVESWADVDRIDVQPKRGVAKVSCRNRWEVQVDLGSGAVLASAYRRSDLIESLHDGSFFGEPAKLWLFLPAALLVLGLWLTGMYLWMLPHASRRARRRREVAKIAS